MKDELEKILTNLRDAGCKDGEVEKAKQLQAISPYLGQRELLVHAVKHNILVN